MNESMNHTELSEPAGLTFNARFETGLRFGPLGSDVAVAVVDPARQLWGLLNILLPDSSMDLAGTDSIAFNAYKYADTAIPRFVTRFEQRGGDFSRSWLGFFGGANLFGELQAENLGWRNVNALRAAAWKAGLVPAVEMLGGSKERTVRIRPELEGVEVTHRGQMMEVFEVQ